MGLRFPSGEPLYLSLAHMSGKQLCHYSSQSLRYPEYLEEKNGERTTRLHEVIVNGNAVATTGD